MIAVKIYWNTNPDGTPVPDDVELEDGPLSYYGPFDSITEAISWMENDYPDGDTDVHDMIADDFDIPAFQLPYVNPPSMFRDGMNVDPVHPDEDIRSEDDEPPLP